MLGYRKYELLDFWFCKPLSVLLLVLNLALLGLSVCERDRGRLRSSLLI